VLARRGRCPPGYGNNDVNYHQQDPQHSTQTAHEGGEEETDVIHTQEGIGHEIGIYWVGPNKDAKPTWPASARKENANVNSNVAWSKNSDSMQWELCTWLLLLTPYASYNFFIGSHLQKYATKYSSGRFHPFIGQWNTNTETRGASRQPTTPWTA
jgi:hypothetical protein